MLQPHLLDLVSVHQLVHSANEKVVRYLGTATTMGSEIDKKLFEDTGIKVKYIPVTTDEVTKRVLTQPNSFDIVDTEYFSLPKLVPSGNILGMDSKRITNLITCYPYAW